MSRIPHFKSEREEAIFWDRHDSTQFLNEFKEASNVKFPVPKHKSVTIDVEESILEKIKKLAQKRHIPYHTLIERWLKERTRTELKLS